MAYAYFRLNYDLKGDGQQQEGESYWLQLTAGSHSDTNIDSDCVRVRSNTHTQQTPPVP